MTRRSPPLLAASIAASIGLVVAPSSAQAGFFDFLFGSAAPPPVRYQPAPYYAPDALEMTVRPRRQVRRPVVTAPAKPKLATPIDPVKNPDWYLDDPTLRRGDIVVLKGRVLVFDGGRRDRTERDFTNLSESRLISKADRAKVGQMAGLPPAPSAAPAAAPKPVASVSGTKEVALRVGE